MSTTAERLEMYRQMYLIRAAEQYIIDHYDEDEMKTPMHMSRGQEAVSVGVLAALGDRAQVFTSYRTHAAYLARTDDVDGFFAELYGKWLGPNGGRAGSMHISNPDKGFELASGIVATQIPIAVGAAFANKRLGSDRIAVVFFGDGATNEGVFWESLNLAVLYSLPILFVYEDNGFAVHTRRRQRQTYRFPLTSVPIYYRQVETLGGILLMKLNTEWCIDNLPALLRIPCYRYLQHVGVEEDYGIYRGRNELELWSKYDAVDKERSFLVENGHTAEIVCVETHALIRVLAAAEKAKFQIFSRRPVENGVYA